MKFFQGYQCSPPLKRLILSDNIKKKWILKQAAPDKAAAISLVSGLLPVTARILVTRGITEPEEVSLFLNPSLSGMLDPFLLKDMQQAVERLVVAREAGEKICIYGDYDVDGISATALLISGFTALGLKTGYHIPNRMEDGYGLNSEALRSIQEHGVSLAISVDCGVTAVEEARLCSEIGLDLIITDHHQPLTSLPAAIAVINPHRADCDYPFKGLAGVGVAFNLLVALRNRLRKQGIHDNNLPDLRQWLDLVALGTIADLVPLTGQNRILTKAGLQRMGKDCRTGMAALKKVAGVQGDVSSGQVGFQLAPRINASGRLESAVTGVELLLTQDNTLARDLADELDAANCERRQIERLIFEEAVAMMEKRDNPDLSRSIVLSSTDWHQGVVGIVASRMVERYYRPTILVAENQDGTGKGSGRSIAGFHLLEAINQCSKYLLRYGGHHAAAGITLKTDEIENFAKAFEQAASTQLTENQLIPELSLDTEIEASELTIDLVSELQKLGPFGMGNPTPVLMLRDMQLVESRCFGNNNLNITVRRNGFQFRTVGWGMADRTVPASMDIAFTAKIDTWNDREQLRLELKDFRDAELNHAAQ